MREYEATLIYLYAHGLTERAAHEEAVKITCRATLFGECREVHILEHAPLYTFLCREHLLQFLYRVHLTIMIACHMIFLDRFCKDNASFFALFTIAIYAVGDHSPNTRDT